MRLLSLLPAMLLWACAADESHNSAAPLFVLKEDWRYAPSNPGASEILGGFLRGGVLPDGRLLVADGDHKIVHIFDSTGRRVGAFGRRGEGPGEFNSPVGIGAIGDTTWVFDLTADGEYELFDRDMRYIGTVPTSLEASGGAVDGLIAGPVSVAGPTWREKNGTPVITLLDKHGAVLNRLPVDTLKRRIRHTCDNQFAGKAFVSPVEARGRFVVLPQSTRALLLLPEDVWAGEGGDLIVHEVSLSDRRVTSQKRIQLPSHKSRPEDAEFFSRDIAFKDSTTANEWKKALCLPVYYPAFQQISLGRDTTLWLQRYADTTRLVLDIAGNQIMRVALPKALRVFSMDRSHVWGMLPDPDGVPIIVRYSLTRKTD